MCFVLRSLLSVALTFAAVGSAATQTTEAPPSDADLRALIADYDLEIAETPVRERDDWRPPQRVLVAADMQRVRWLQSAAPDVELIPITSSTARISDADALLGTCSAELIARNAALRWIQIMSAGAERCVRLDAFAARQPLLTNMQRISAPIIAEHAIAMVLSLSRQLPAFQAAQRSGRWARDPALTSRMQVIHGKTMLVAGLGGIGTQIARRAHALGMTITATRASTTDGPDFVSEIGLPDRLPALASQADVVVNALPLTDETANLFDAALFDRMMDGTLFINVGRGGTVVTADLIEALENGPLAGAGLDVTAPEPLPADHPLWNAPNTIITPHVASRSDLPREARWRVVYVNLQRYANGDPMVSVVPPDRGY